MLKFINLKFTKIVTLIIYCGLIFWLSSKPSIPTPSLFPHQDKVFHMGAYFGMGILAWRFFRDYFSSLSATISSVCFCTLYGMSDEWHQSFVPGRDTDLLDLLADTTGGLLAVSFIYFVNKKQIKYLSIWF